MYPILNVDFHAHVIGSNPKDLKNFPLLDMAPVLLLYCCLSLSAPYFPVLEEAQCFLQRANSIYSSNCWLCTDAANGGLGYPYPATPEERTAIKASLAYTATLFSKANPPQAALGDPQQSQTDLEPYMAPAPSILDPSFQPFSL